MSPRALATRTRTRALTPACLWTVRKRVVSRIGAGGRYPGSHPGPRLCTAVIFCRAGTPRPVIPINSL